MLQLWAVVAGGGIVADLASGQVAGVWLAGAAALAALLGALGLPPDLQALAFVVAASALVALVRPLVVRQRASAVHHTEMLVGKLGSVLDPVDPQLASGRVVIEGVAYVARCAAGAAVLATGAPIRVSAVEAGEIVVERL